MIRRLVVTASALVALSSYGLVKNPDYLEARRNGAKTKVVLKVVDDLGCAVSNAVINVFLGMNFRPKGYSINGISDEMGFFTIEGKTCGDEIEIHIDKPGYYVSRRKLCYATIGKEHSVDGGKWLPYGDVQQMVLRKKRHPVAMPSERFWQFRYTKEMNSWIGFDICKNDFVRPHGMGEIADFEILIDWDGEWLPKYKGMGVKIRFTEPFSGYYDLPVDSESAFTGPYEADTTRRYVQNAEFSEKVREDGEVDASHFNKARCWVVRSRCKVDDRGNLVSANYSVIHDIVFTCKKGRLGGFSITGAFNPTPNDTNLEPQ